MSTSKDTAPAQEWREALAAWLKGQVADADDLLLEGLDRVDLGHSAEMFAFTMVGRRGGDERREDLVVKVRPPSPGLLEPYDLERQFRILRALEPTRVCAPRARWYEGTGAVIGREFFVMERVAGDTFEREVPAELDEPGRIPHMCESLVDQLAEIHLVDLDATGLAGLGDGTTYPDREISHWRAEMRRVQRGPLPALERLVDELTRRQPKPSGQVTLVHGDAKPGNFGFVDDRVSAVFDWEMTDVGDPSADIAYLELMWSFPVGITSRPTAPPFEQMLERWQARTGMALDDRPWWRALQAYKTAVILLIGSMLFEAGHSDDMRYLEMGFGIDMITGAGLRDLGVDEALDTGPVLPSDERIAAARAAARRE